MVFLKQLKFLEKGSKIKHAQVAKLCVQSDVHHTIPRRTGTSQKLRRGANISSPVAKYPHILGFQRCSKIKNLCDEHMVQYTDEAS